MLPALRLHDAPGCPANAAGRPYGHHLGCEQPSLANQWLISHFIEVITNPKQKCKASAHRKEPRTLEMEQT